VCIFSPGACPRTEESWWVELAASTASLGGGWVASARVSREAQKRGGLRQRSHSARVSQRVCEDEEGVAGYGRVYFIIIIIMYIIIIAARSHTRVTSKITFVRIYIYYIYIYIHIYINNECEGSASQHLFLFL